MYGRSKAIFVLSVVYPRFYTCAGIPLHQCKLLLVLVPCHGQCRNSCFVLDGILISTSKNVVGMVKSQYPQCITEAPVGRTF